jgi:hypothetical protein
MRKVLHRFVVGPYRIGPPSSSALIRARNRVFSEDIVPSELVDPSKWLGVYSFDAGLGNTVTSSPGGSLVESSSLINVVGSGGPGDSGFLQYAGFTGAGQQASALATMPSTLVSSFSICCFRRNVGSAFTTGSIGIHQGTAARCGFGTVSNDITAHGVAVGGGLVVAGSGWHHYAATYDSTTGRVQHFTNGGFRSDNVTTAGLSTLATSLGLTASAQNHDEDSLCFYNGILSNAAILALARGYLPDASGSLFQTAIPIIT